MPSSSSVSSAFGLFLHAIKRCTFPQHPSRSRTQHPIFAFPIPEPQTPLPHRTTTTISITHPPPQLFAVGFADALMDLSLLIFLLLLLPSSSFLLLYLPASAYSSCFVFVLLWFLSSCASSPSSCSVPLALLASPRPIFLFPRAGPTAQRVELHRRSDPEAGWSILMLRSTF